MDRFCSMQAIKKPDLDKPSPYKPYHHEGFKLRSVI